jgi:beta-glucosidase
MIRQKKTHSKKKGAIRPGLVITSLLLAVSIGVTGTAVYFKDIVNLYLAADRTRVSEEEMEKTAQESQLLSHRIQEEGSVLLKNTKDTLPLSDSIRQVNVFGWASTQWLG